MFGLPDIPDALVRGFVLALLGVTWIAVLVRFAGLRTLSKMSAIDFVVTLATGSLLASMIASEDWPAFVQAAAGVASLTALQYGYSRLRRNDGFRQRAENQPRLLMRDGAFLEEAMRETRVTRADILGKLREAGVSSPDDVKAMILEATGDISIERSGEVDPRLLAGVAG